MGSSLFMFERFLSFPEIEILFFSGIFVCVLFLYGIVAK